MRPLAWMAALSLAAVPVLAQQAAAPPAPYTAEQAERGEIVYGEKCALCHGPGMAGGGFGPSLKGARFKRTWGARSAGELYEYVAASMPPGQGDSLSAEERADVIAYMLSLNGAAAGETELPPDPAALKAFGLPAPAPSTAGSGA